MIPDLATLHARDPHAPVTRVEFLVRVRNLAVVAKEINAHAALDDLHLLDEAEDMLGVIETEVSAQIDKIMAGRYKRYNDAKAKYRAAKAYIEQFEQDRSR